MSINLYSDPTEWCLKLGSPGVDSKMSICDLLKQCSQDKSRTGPGTKPSEDMYFGQSLSLILRRALELQLLLGVCPTSRQVSRAFVCLRAISGHGCPQESTLRLTQLSAYLGEGAPVAHMQPLSKVTGAGQ